MSFGYQRECELIGTDLVNTISHTQHGIGARESDVNLREKEVTVRENEVIIIERDLEYRQRDIELRQRDLELREREALLVESLAARRRVRPSGRKKAAGKQQATTMPKASSWQAARTLITH